MGGKYIYFFSQAGGIIDTNQDKILEADKSCVKLTNYPKDVYRDSYKNDYIDPFTERVYKGISIMYWNEDAILAVSQGFSSGGGLCDDGRIYLYMGQDEVKCEISAELKCRHS